MTILRSIYTAARAESEYGLQPGTIRQYIKRHPELVHAGEFVKADARTWIAHQDTIERIWGRATLEAAGYQVEAYSYQYYDLVDKQEVRYRAYAPDGEIIDDGFVYATGAYNAARSHYTSK